MRYLMIILFLSFGGSSIMGQTYSMAEHLDLRFEGYANEKIVFKDKDKLIYLWDESSPIRLQFLDSGRLPFFPEKFVGLIEMEGSNRRYIETFKLPFKVIVTTPSKTYSRKLDMRAEGISTDFLNLKVYIGNQTDNPNLHESLQIHQLDLATGDLIELPIKGVNPLVAMGYLFYADYPNPEQFDLVYDIYRVKIDDWDNPEKVFENNYMNNWLPSDDGENLLVEIIESGYSPQKVIFNLEQKKYLLIEETDLPEAVFYSKNRKAFCFYDISLQNGQRRFVYIETPKVFSHTPDWAMSFENSLINNYWIEEAPEDSLKTLSISDLRLLRNSIFAKRGWRFNDESLTDYFKQFSWYEDQLKSVESNERIQLTNLDKYRSQLIMEIEKSKK